MKKIKLKICGFRNPLRGIQSGDIFLIIFMCIFFIQMILNIFIFQNSFENNYIDVILRTTAAAVFGYFLSTNFLSNCDPDDITEEKTTIKSRRYQKCKKQQVFIVGWLGIISLILILLCRYLIHDLVETRVIASQLRDFVSGSVGFLVGSPINEAKGNKDTKTE